VYGKLKLLLTTAKEFLVQASAPKPQRRRSSKLITNSSSLPETVAEVTAVPVTPMDIRLRKCIHDCFTHCPNMLSKFTFAKLKQLCDDFLLQMKKDKKKAPNRNPDKKVWNQFIQFLSHYVEDENDQISGQYNRSPLQELYKKEWNKEEEKLESEMNSQELLQRLEKLEKKSDNEFYLFLKENQNEIQLKDFNRIYHSLPKPMKLRTVYETVHSLLVDYNLTVSNIQDMMKVNPSILLPESTLKQKLNYLLKQCSLDENSLTLEENIVRNEEERMANIAKRKELFHNFVLYNASSVLFSPLEAMQQRFNFLYQSMTFNTTEIQLLMSMKPYLFNIPYEQLTLMNNLFQEIYSFRFPQIKSLFLDHNYRLYNDGNEGNPLLIFQDIYERRNIFINILGFKAKDLFNDLKKNYFLLTRSPAYFYDLFNLLIKEFQIETIDELRKIVLESPISLLWFHKPFIEKKIHHFYQLLNINIKHKIKESTINKDRFLPLFSAELEKLKCHNLQQTMENTYFPKYLLPKMEYPDETQDFSYLEDAIKEEEMKDSLKKGRKHEAEVVPVDNKDKDEDENLKMSEMDYQLLNEFGQGMSSNNKERRQVLFSNNWKEKNRLKKLQLLKDDNSFFQSFLESKHQHFQAQKENITYKIWQNTSYDTYLKNFFQSQRSFDLVDIVKGTRKDDHLEWISRILEPYGYSMIDLHRYGWNELEKLNFPDSLNPKQLQSLFSSHQMISCHLKSVLKDLGLLSLWLGCSSGELLQLMMKEPA
jgi:hypothetical protein